MVRMADRIIANGMHPPQASWRTRPLFADDQAQIVERLRGWLSGKAGRIPAILADNVAASVEEHVRQAGGWFMEDFTCLAPPWPTFWIEYPSSSGNERRGVLVIDVTDQERKPDGAFQGAIDDARAVGYDGPIGWVLDFTMHIEDVRRGEVIGPIGWLVLVLDQYGYPVGNRWVLNTDAGAQVIDSARMGADGSGQEVNMTEWLLAAYVTALQSINLLNCRNVETEPVPVPPRLARAHRRRRGHPPVRFRTIRLTLPGRATAPGAPTGQPAGLTAATIVPGHFTHYGNCCPTRPGCPGPHGHARCAHCGGHEPHGLLFGRLEGRFRVPQHLRGDAHAGINLNDYDLSTRSTP